MMYVWLIVGFVLLVKGADLFVDGSASIARILRVPSVIIGLTLVAMGTSAPEAAVSITAGLTGNNEIAVGNVIGSNIFNLIFIVGICAVIKVFAVDKDILKRDFLVSIAAAVILLLMILNGDIARWEGLILIAGMAAYLVVTIRAALKERTTDTEEVKTMPVPKSIIFIIIGLAAIILGGQLVVNSASDIAISWGMSQTLVGLTIVAIGTSLPELVTSVVASRKGDSGLALGNVIGSNIFNILFILGVSSLLHPIAVSAESIFDSIFLIAASVVMFVYCKISKKVGRIAGIVSILAYIGYTAYIIMR